MTIGVIDVGYPTMGPLAGGARAVMALIEDWTSWNPNHCIIHDIQPGSIQPYEPGSFYKRELPPMLDVISRFNGKLDAIIVDAYVWLGIGVPGLGKRLYDSLDAEVPVVGAAKSRYAGTQAVCAEVLRGGSRRPLYVTAEGISLHDAASYIGSMHGMHRFPSAIKHVDMLTRT